MKTTVLAMILACAFTAGAQDAAQAQTPPSAGGGGQQAAAPEIKDPNEYNAYVAAIQQELSKRLDGLYFTNHVEVIALGVLATFVVALWLAFTA